MSGLVVGRRRRIYYERSSSTPESEAGLEELVAGGIRCHCSRVLVARIVYHPAPGSTSPSVAPCAVATKDRQQMPAAVAGEGGFPGTAEACPSYQATWSAPWGVGESVKVLVCPPLPRKEG